MSATGYDEEHLAEITLLGELVDRARNAAGRLTPQELDQLFDSQAARSN